MQINSINNVNFGVWQNKGNSEKLLKELSKQAGNDYSQEDLKAMYDELDFSENLYTYNEESNRIQKYNRKKGYFRTIHKRGDSLLDAIEKEYLKLIRNK